MRNFFLLHHRFLLAALAGILFFLGVSLSLPYRLSIGWVAGTGCFLVLVTLMMSRVNVATLRKRAARLDVSDTLLFTLMIMAAFLSLYAVLSLLHESKHVSGFTHHATLGLAFLTVVLSWLFVQTIFAVHYAHHYYLYDDPEQDCDDKGGLEFPHGHTNGEDPDYWDFAYFSFVIGMTFQVSDVQITQRHIRRLVLAHSVTAFFFNTVIIALIVNLAASAFG